MSPGDEGAVGHIATKIRLLLRSAKAIAAAHGVSHALKEIIASQRHEPVPTLPTDVPHVEDQQPQADSDLLRQPAIKAAATSHGCRRPPSEHHRSGPTLPQNQIHQHNHQSAAVQGDVILLDDDNDDNDVSGVSAGNRKGEAMDIVQLGEQLLREQQQVKEAEKQGQVRCRRVAAEAAMSVRKDLLDLAVTLERDQRRGGGNRQAGSKVECKEKEEKTCSLDGYTKGSSAGAVKSAAGSKNGSCRRPQETAVTIESFYEMIN